MKEYYRNMTTPEMIEAEHQCHKGIITMHRHWLHTRTVPTEFEKQVLQALANKAHTLDDMVYERLGLSYRG